MNYSVFVRNTLLEIIETIASDPQPYCFNPEKDFTRKRKLSFEEMLRLIIVMEGSSIKKELLKYFDFDAETATSSAFIQQRSKIKPKVFEQILHDFNNKFDCSRLYKGYRLIACDGSGLITISNPKDIDHHYNFKENHRKFNMTYFNTLYDILNRRYLDAIVQPGYKPNERAALMDMMDRFSSDDPSIFIGDRGYTSFNIYAFAQEKNKKFIIRAKEKEIQVLLEERDLDFNTDFDYSLNLILTQFSKKEFKNQPKLYKFINKKYFQFYDEDGFYPISFRVVRIPLGEDSYEYLITNLSKEEFDAKALKELYHLRWGIETSFRQLKYATGLVNLHTKKAEHIKQEIFSKLILYNFCEIIAANIIINKKERKHAYQLNFTLAIHICRYLLRLGGDKSPPDVEKLIQKELLPIRNNRKFPRKIHNKSPVYFVYRAA